MSALPAATASSRGVVPRPLGSALPFGRAALSGFGRSAPSRPTATAWLTALTSDPASMRRAETSPDPARMASTRGVLPARSAALASALAARSAATTSVRPVAAAACSGVRPSASATSTLAPFARSAVTFSSGPSVAVNSGVAPVGSVAFGSAPA